MGPDPSLQRAAGRALFSVSSQDQAGARRAPSSFPFLGRDEVNSSLPTPVLRGSVACFPQKGQNRNKMGSLEMFHKR